MRMDAPNPDDGRILQALLTPAGRSELAAAKGRQNIWRATLLSDDDYPMATATQVVRTIRQRRLERDARELAKRRRAQPVKRGP